MAILTCWVAAALLATATPDVTASDKLVAMYVRNGIAELGLDGSLPEGREKIARLEQAVRDEMRDRSLIEAEAIRRKLPIAEHLPERTRRWIARFGGEAGYRAYLGEHQLMPPEFERVIRQEVAADLLREALTAEVRVAEEEVAAFYERERSNPALEALFVAPETVTASHILVAARPGLHTDMDARRARADELRRRLDDGADFAAVAREHSDDAGTRPRGGDLGAFTRETHTAAFDRAAFALAPGQTSPVVQTEYGFHIIRATARSPRRTRTLTELRSAIEARLIAQKSAEHLRAWLAQRRAEPFTPSPSTEKR